MSQEFSRTENRILGALARLDDFLTNPLIQGHSGTALETSRNVLSISQGTKKDDSQRNPHPEAGLFNNQMAQNSGPEDHDDMVAGVQRERERERECLRPWHIHFHILHAKNCNTFFAFRKKICCFISKMIFSKSSWLHYNVRFHFLNFHLHIFYWLIPIH